MRVLLKGERYSSCFLCRIKEHIADAVLGILIGASVIPVIYFVYLRGIVVFYWSIWCI